MNNLNKEKKEWLRNTAIFYYQIFSKKYNKEFTDKLLKGGGGNSTLCGSWYKLSNEFQQYRISDKALKKFDEIKFSYSVNEKNISVEQKEITKNKNLFSSNRKTIEERKKAGKLFHFDHNPSNVKVLKLINSKVKELVASSLSEEKKIDVLEEFIFNVQTLDLITIEQDAIVSNADKKIKNRFSADVRNKLLNDVWHELIIK